MSLIFSQIRLFLRPQEPPNPNPNPAARSHPNPESFLDMGEAGSAYRSEMQGIFAIIGVVAGFCFSIACIIVGGCIFHHSGRISDVVTEPGSWRQSTFEANRTPYTGLIAILPNARLPAEVLGLLLSFVVTVFTESIGFVHSVALKSTLASDAQLAFNTNPRLFSLMSFARWRHPNGPVFNALMGALLTLSYSTASLSFIPVLSAVSNDGEPSTWWSTCVFGAPITILGVTIFLQAAIATYSIRTVTVLTWSSSPFDTAVALLRNGLVTRRTGRNMHTVIDTDDELAPARKHQPSAWQSHPVVWKVVICLWLLCFACAIWGGWMYAIWVPLERAEQLDGSQLLGLSGTGLHSWSLIPDSKSVILNLIYNVDPAGGISIWPAIFALFAAAQGSLTFGLHCVELNVNIMRDELQWRQASTPSGMAMSRNPIIAVLGSWPNVMLLVAKPTLHWLFGLAMAMRATANPQNDPLLTISIVNRPQQIWNLSGALLIVAIALTCLALYRPRGVQPATFGHIQTIANVIDVWAPRIWWGYKVTNESIGHAGTSDWPLPPMDFRPSKIV
ncbi:hypothetical protein FIBSPDRAFT_1055551 [Athelia psychrophila]|uniref:Uncharacterized protein n=1 Tax=Athelia psychrophila TaxID=1759441 RepID=A0A167THB1_9AGAM|nr:hypothetical protein FIBSPDRAFT_1055551 [Fibularhizoctonia sp. CBS 109695]